MSPSCEDVSESAVPEFGLSIWFFRCIDLHVKVVTTLEVYWDCYITPTFEFCLYPLKRVKLQIMKALKGKQVALACITVVDT